MKKEHLIRFLLLFYNTLFKEAKKKKKKTGTQTSEY